MQKGGMFRRSSAVHKAYEPVAQDLTLVSQAIRPFLPSLKAHMKNQLENDRNPSFDDKARSIYMRGCSPRLSISPCYSILLDESLFRRLRKGRRKGMGQRQSKESCDRERAWRYNTNSGSRFVPQNHQSRTY